ncbi:MAG: hypothetical protein HDR49_00530 [Bacteroides sp.]|nr:hypothetical protein [Bacteroides sp.]
MKKEIDDYEEDDVLDVEEVDGTESPDETADDPEQTDDDLESDQEEPDESYEDSDLDEEEFDDSDLEEEDPETAGDDNDEEIESETDGDYDPEQLTARERVRRRLAEKYPDRDLDDEDEYYNSLGEHLDSLDGRLHEYDEANKPLVDLIDKDPRSAAFLVDWMEGRNPAVSMIRNYGVDLREMLDDENAQEEFSQAHAEFLERTARNRELEEEYNRNLGTSLDQIEAWKAEKGVGDEEAETIFDTLTAMMQNLIVGKIDPAMLDMALAAHRHDADVENARGQGEIAGRNAKIEEKLRKPKSRRGDGIPALGSANAGAARRPTSIFDLAREAQ